MAEKPTVAETKAERTAAETAEVSALESAKGSHAAHAKHAGEHGLVAGHVHHVAMHDGTVSSGTLIGTNDIGVLLSHGGEFPSFFPWSSVKSLIHA